MRSGALFKSARLRLGLSQHAFADLVGVAPPTMSAYESGRRQPTIPTLLRLLAKAGLELRVRTPLKLVLVDRWRRRRLPCTVLAARVAGAELAALAGLGWAAVATASRAFFVPLLVAAPFAAVQLRFDVRSRGRRLVPEPAGAIGVSAVAASIALARGGPPVSPRACGW